ncbi:NAD(P)/FAD-dependent oxidoreductase [Streptococcus caprae]|uniref:NAD(P)/FAD-dependent oxidoreductase n=1 Tax=Streptococcus caprae TaxID=1640501 RepID=A0ABV8CYC8_9STRE
MKQVAIIGAGIVGSTAAYYLSREEDVQVTVFDDGEGQATKAAAGIISPWFSRRRNKAWYKMARMGADFYQKLIGDLAEDGHEVDFYDQSGVILIKSRLDWLDELYELAKVRKEESPLIGDLEILSYEETIQRYPGLEGFEKVLYASGAARVEGARLTKTLLKASGAEIICGRVGFEKTADGRYRIGEREFDALILACGAWLPLILKDHGLDVWVRPQKGQINDYQFDHLETGLYPVIMPHGEIDIIPFGNGTVSVGASHENDKGYDLTLDQTVLDRQEERALPYFPQLKEAKNRTRRVGIRAYTRDFSPFFGEVPGLPKVYAASGLGSSGLTIGPITAYQMVDMVMGRQPELEPVEFAIEKHLQVVVDEA